MPAGQSSTPKRKGDVEFFDNLQWSKLWEGSGNGATAFVTDLYSVIWWVTYLAVCAPMMLKWEKSQVFFGLQPGELCSL